MFCGLVIQFSQMGCELSREFVPSSALLLLICMSSTQIYVIIMSVVFFTIIVYIDQFGVSSTLLCAMFVHTVNL